MRISQRLYTAIILVVVSFSLLVLSQQVTSTSADTLVKHIKDDGALLQPNETIYSKWRLTQRVKPIHSDKLADPYHLPIEPEPSAFTMERWSQKRQNGDILWAVRSFTDDGTLLAATSFDGTAAKHYDRPSNLFVSSPAPDQAPSTNNAFNPQVLGSTDTKFGSAWIVLLYSDQVTSDTGDTTPYYADLQPKAYERVAVIQKDSMRVVQWITRIRTVQGDIIPIMTQTLDTSNIKQNSAVDSSVFRLDVPKDATEIDQDSPPTPNANNGGTISDTQRSLPFSLIVPNEAKANIILQNIYSNASPSVRTQAERRIFDIQDAARNGKAVEIHYLPSDPQASSGCIETVESCAKKTLVVIEGPAHTLSKEMKRQRLLWDESRAVQVQLADQTISGYMATGGALQQANQIAFLAEVNDTFIFIIGQHYTEQELLQIVATLQRVQ